MIFDYASKKAMKECIGKPLRFRETSMFGSEYLSNGSFSGCNRPHLTGHKREFFARVTMQNDVIASVS